MGYNKWGFWNNHVLKSTEEYLSDQERELQYETKKMWQKLKLHLVYHFKACMTILMYGFAVVAVLAMLIGVIGFTVLSLDRYSQKVKLEASMQSADTICLPRNKKE